MSDHFPTFVPTLRVIYCFFKNNFKLYDRWKMLLCSTLSFLIFREGKHFNLFCIYLLSWISFYFFLLCSYWDDVFFFFFPFFFFLSGLHVQCRGQRGARTYNPEIKTWTKIKNETQNQLSHPGAPPLSFLSHHFYHHVFFGVVLKRDDGTKEAFRPRLEVACIAFTQHSIGQNWVTWSHLTT